MDMRKLAGYLCRLGGWLAAIVLIGLTSAAIKEDWNGAVYVINAAFLLFGGAWVGDKLANMLERHTAQSSSSDEGL